jgi:(+)-trans-carveol dehydrogenase/(-)-trans-carveol dehydrogenase
MGRMSGKVALITGAARGQGRSHAVRLAEEGADIVALDLAGPIESVPYDLPSPGELDMTVSLVEALGRRIVARRGDVRDQAVLDGLAAEAVDAFGSLDVVVANAGIFSWGASWLQSEQQWREMIDINLTGVWHTVKAAIPPMLEAGRGGSIVITSSILGLRGAQQATSYSAAKHGVIGLTKSLAVELGPHRIRVNTVNPSNVATKMIQNDAVYKLFRPDAQGVPDEDEVARLMAASHPMGVPWVEPRDISDAVLFLASDEARFITGTSLPVDAGLLAR